MLFVRHALFWFCTSFKLLFIISEISSFDSLLVTVWGFMLMKTFISTSCMFPVKISCFNGGIFHSDDIQHVIIVGVFTNDTIYTVLRFSPSVAKSIYCTKKAKNFSLLFQIFSWDMKSFLADLLSIFFLNAKDLVRKLFFDFLNLEDLRWEVIFSCYFTVFFCCIGLGTW